MTKRPRHTPDQVIRKLAEGNELLARGAELDEVCRHLQIPDPLHEQQPAMKRKTSVTVTHEDLRVVKTAISTAPGVFALGQPVTNVVAEYI